MKVDLYYSEPHYEAHLRPIWDALPAEVRGIDHGMTKPSEHRAPRPRHVALVASWQDMSPLRGLAHFIYVEHGAGQGYGSDRRSAHFPGYSTSGGSRHRDVIGYICPNEQVAARWRNARTAAVGSPYLDRWLPFTPRPGIDTVAFVFHWPCKVSPESDTAWWHFAPGMPAVVDGLTQAGFRVFGHPHPKWEGRLDKPMAEVGLDVVPIERVMEEAALLFVDNSSVGPEFMALGKPVVWLNAPGYRRHIHHGGRFWEWTRGTFVVDEPQQIAPIFVRGLLAYDNIHGLARREIVDSVYAYTDGKSSHRAAEAICRWLDELS